MGRSKIHVTWITVCLLIAAAGAGLFLWQRQRNDDEVSRLREQIAQFTGETFDDSSTEPSQSADTTQASSIEELPVVIFNPNGLFDDPLIDRFRQKIINPITLYSADGGNPVTAMLIETSQVDGEFVVNVIHDDGVFESFLTGGESGIVWTPACLDSCAFSDQFKTKYPDIVDSTQ